MENKILYCNGVQFNMAKDCKTMVLHFYAHIPDFSTSDSDQEVQMAQYCQASIVLDDDGIASFVLGMSQMTDELNIVVDDLKERFSDEQEEA